MRTEERITEPRAGSLNELLSNIPIGGYLYLEIDASESQKLQARIHTPTRRPDILKMATFVVGVYTAVAAKKIGDVRLLLRIGRTG